MDKQDVVSRIEGLAAGDCDDNYITVTLWLSSGAVITGGLDEVNDDSVCVLDAQARWVVIERAHIVAVAWASGRRMNT